MGDAAPRRSYGTGSLFVRADAAGREAWYGQWRVDGRLVKRKVGPKRSPGSRDGLTKAQAEKELRMPACERRSRWSDPLRVSASGRPPTRWRRRSSLIDWRGGGC